MIDVDTYLEGLDSLRLDGYDAKKIVIVSIHEQSTDLEHPTKSTH